ncbi:MAG: hypothetical protein RLZZ630_650 [Bacteroidota bacterium]|jgi:hypothetical protein
MKATYFLPLFIFFIQIANADDILILKNEKVFEGKVIRIKNCGVVFKVDRERYEIPADDIHFIQFGDTVDKVYMDYLKRSETDPDQCLKGWLDAKKYHGKKEVHFILGFLFGPYAMLGTLLAKPTPEKGVNTLSNSVNREQFSDPEYLRCYRQKAKADLITMEAIGHGMMIGVVGVALLVAWGATTN